MGERLSWDLIRKRFPNQYVLLRNCRESQSGDVSTILDGEVLESSADPKQILDHFRRHKQSSEVLFGYTGWKKFELELRPFLGIRPAHG